MTTRRTIRWGAAAVRVATILTGVMACLWGGMPLLAQDGTPKGPAAAAGEMRTWTDMTGKVSRAAEFLKAEDGQVHLVAHQVGQGRRIAFVGNVQQLDSGQRVEVFEGKMRWAAAARGGIADLAR